MCLQCKNCVIHIPERFRGELLTMGRYTNLYTFTFTYLLTYRNSLSKRVVLTADRCVRPTSATSSYSRRCRPSASSLCASHATWKRDFSTLRTVWWRRSVKWLRLVMLRRDSSPRSRLCGHSSSPLKWGVDIQLCTVAPNLVVFLFLRNCPKLASCPPANLFEKVLLISLATNAPQSVTNGCTNQKKYFCTLGWQHCFT